MPNVRAVPTLRRRRLGNALRGHRRDARLSLGAAAGPMGWDESKLSRIETGQARIQPQFIAPLLRQYGVGDPEVVGALEELARDAGRRGWWAGYGNLVDLSYRDYLTLETDALGTQVYSPGVVPGLLQTGRYAREVIAGTSTRPPEEIASLAHLHGTRQAVLTSRDNGLPPLRLWAVIHEGVFYQRFAAGPALMREQLRHLLEVSELPHVTVQVMPLTAPPHPGLLGLFEIIRFKHPSPPVVNLETVRGGHFVEGADDVRRFEEAFERIAATALPADDSRTRIAHLIDRTRP
ncbi:helix-turn-helix transcriptional regulator [Streptomyces sp. DSM 44915]|uniref:Helix-turn-helix transcriptional regulator n=1 Tax=Streptomyces chisholmiae TaxID=3075540 RepID=A0ABU2JL31_9ACTN|nr:helix-turn-helix transcriptional regulator [Streptomyces sp. DSM 44915]MDT0265696.1 helix-turn-helix transcriptional regulator [Streptomyces sp. DSM 44915]